MQLAARHRRRSHPEPDVKAQGRIGPLKALKACKAHDARLAKDAWCSHCIGLAFHFTLYFRRVPLPPDRGFEGLLLLRILEVSPGISVRVLYIFYQQNEKTEQLRRRRKIGGSIFGIPPAHSLPCNKVCSPPNPFQCIRQKPLLGLS